MLYFNEPMPDCVPEFFRAQQEEQEHQDELLMQRQEHYRANRMTGNTIRRRTSIPAW